jgi:DNA (cytosine-5)-methyltransferase 1
MNSNKFKDFLLGFPADFKLVGSKKEQIKQIGNAVPPPLIQQIVKKLIS